jgi:hypothetical protein
VSIWILLQIVVNVLFLVGLSVCIVKVFKDKADDPRLNQGLRLLQSKISILEDLSDHTENQVKQLMMLLDKKLHEVRGTLSTVNDHITEVDRSIQKSQKMAEIIRDEIPHTEIVEKKLENKYIRAAQMAHSGADVDEIVKALGLPRAEVELIAKVNRKKCVYDNAKNENSVKEQLFSKSLELPEIETTSMGRTQLNFHQAVHDHKEKDQSDFESIKLG